MAVQSSEYKASKAFLKIVGDLDFRPNIFAYYLSTGSIAMQERTIDLLLALVDHHSNKLDEGLYSDQDIDLCVKAKRVQDAMVPFR